MRVISGIKKGFKLKAPKGKDIRPTEDRIKESLFNIIKNIDEESVVLDLFAGSGSIGIEFLSRGAKKSYFVDKSYLSIKCIKENLKHTNLEDKAVVIKRDAIKAIKFFCDNNIKFTHIFIDPPYGKGLILDVLKRIADEDVLKEDGIVIVEHERDLILEDRIGRIIIKDNRNYGSKSLTFYELDGI